jgi:hypothetical protein
MLMLIHPLLAPAFNIDALLGSEAQRFHQFWRRRIHNGDNNGLLVALQQQCVMALTE